MRELKVVLDTNVIYNTSAADVLKGEASELIKASFRHTDLIITWYLPEVVRNEREHQIREAARESLPAIRKLERVLDHNFGVTDRMINDRIRDRIDGEIDRLKIRILPVDPYGVDWAKMMSDAAFRQPPFAPGKHEKGFRDAIIVEAVGQLLASSPDSRIAVVTGDELLTKAITIKTSRSESVHVVPSIEEFKGLINTLVSNVDEAFIQQMKAAAASLFFESGNRETYLYKSDVTKTIITKFSSYINAAVPEGADDVERDKTLVSRPRFKEKVGDRMYWVSRIAFRLKAYSDSYNAFALGSTNAPSGYFGYSEFAGYSSFTNEPSESIVDAPESTGVISLGPTGYKVTKLPYKIGHVAFDVTWSVVVSTDRQLVGPKIESIDYVETTWQ